MKDRNERYDAIKAIIREQHIKTQHDLVEQLKERGFSCTQATVSRDITELNLRKLPEGRYMLAEDLRLSRMITDFVVDVNRANNLVVIKTSTGSAQGVAAALDAIDAPMILGTIAGDDTILVIASDNEEAENFAQGLDTFKVQ